MKTERTLWLAMGLLVNLGASACGSEKLDVRSRDSQDGVMVNGEISNGQAVFELVNPTYAAVSSVPAIEPAKQNEPREQTEPVKQNEPAKQNEPREQIDGSVQPISPVAQGVIKMLCDGFPGKEISTGSLVNPTVKALSLKYAELVSDKEQMLDARTFDITRCSVIRLVFDQVKAGSIYNISSSIANGPILTHQGSTGKFGATSGAVRLVLKRIPSPPPPAKVEVLVEIEK